jgi:tungstate transport system permease protein
MLGQALSKAIAIIFTFDRTFLEIVLLSLGVSGIAILVATGLGLLITALLEFYPCRGKGLIITGVNTLTGLPPVVVGLGLYIVLSRSGPLGFMHLLYTPWAMIIAQIILATPIITALSHAAVNSSGQQVRMTALSLGADKYQAMMALLKDARYGIFASVAAAFGRVMAEVGAVLLVGGNIAHHTRVMTTAIALEADKGEFELAIALGIILLSLSFLVNALFYMMQKKGAKR